jgi:ATP adenylyltransferase
MICPFCSIEKERLIFDGKTVFVILSNPHLMESHMLVVPKRHVEKLSELGEDERKELFDTAIEFQEKLLKKFPGCDIRQNCRPFLPESSIKVNHVHFHLQPRSPEDELYTKSQKFEKELFKPLEKD